LHQKKELFLPDTILQEQEFTPYHLQGIVGEIMLSGSNSIQDSATLALNMALKGCLFKGDILTVFLQILKDGQLVICLLDIFTLTDHQGTPQIKVIYQEEHFQIFTVSTILKLYLESLEVMLQTLLKTIGSILQKEISRTKSESGTRGGAKTKPSRHRVRRQSPVEERLSVHESDSMSDAFDDDGLFQIDENFLMIKLLAKMNKYHSCLSFHFDINISQHARMQS
jgi:hypothetical protein